MSILASTIFGCIYVLWSVYIDSVSRGGDPIYSIISETVLWIVFYIFFVGLWKFYCVEWKKLSDRSFFRVVFERIWLPLVTVFLVTNTSHYESSVDSGWMLIAAFLIIAAIILFSFFTRRVGAFILASVAFYSLENRIEELAADDSLSPEEFVRRARIAMAVAITAAVLPLSSSSTNAYGQAREVAFRIWVSGFLSIIGIQLFS